MTSKEASTIQRSISDGQLVIAPGCYDLVGAKVLASLDVGAGYLTPFGYQASDEPHPDAPSDPWRRMLRRAETIIRTTGLDLIVDTHTGIEGAHTLSERIEDSVASGAAAVVIEDRQGFGPTAPLEPISAMTRVIDHARTLAGPGVVLIVRTDAVRESLVDARERAEHYLEVGADLVMPLMTSYLTYPDTPASKARREEAYDFLLERLPARRIVVHSPTGRHMSVERARQRGFATYLMPQLLIAATVTSMRHEMRHVLDGSASTTDLIQPAELADLTGIGQWLKARW